MLTYSVAIRTQGTSGELLRQELESIKSQSVKPEKVIIYLAEGYTPPDFRVSDEVYVSVKKGMVAQRALEYDEINSEVILMLDDDVTLQPDSVEKILTLMEKENLDAMGADVFENHKMSVKDKLFAVISNLIFPHFDQKWAIKIRLNGSFSYLLKPKKDWYPTQSFAGPAMAVRKDIIQKNHWEEELFLDNLEYAYGDDMLESYKLFCNCYKLGMVFNSGVVHHDGKSASRNFKKGANLRTRSQAQYIIWHRCIFNPSGSKRRILSTISFGLKLGWQTLGISVLSVIKWNRSLIVEHMKGVKEARQFIKSERYRSLSPYIIR